MFISIVINADTRTGFDSQESDAGQMFDGCKSLDFLIAGVQNKINFFKDFSHEVILFIDEHHPVPQDILERLRAMCDVVVLRKHTKLFSDMENYAGFNDLNYLQALQLSRGTHIAHFDQDCAAFREEAMNVLYLLEMCDKYSFVCYPSEFSPGAVTDPSFDYMWASTRFFICKRDALDFTEIMKCLLNYEYMYDTYPASRKAHWTEHILGLLAKYKGKGVFYPPINDYLLIFCWHKYYSGVLPALNAMTHENVVKYVKRCGGVTYHGVTAIKI